MRPKRLLWMALGLAFVLSLASAWFLGPRRVDDLRFDSAQYHTLAVNMLRYHDYSLHGAMRHWPPDLATDREWYPDDTPETYWPPGYPAMLAAVYAVAGPGLAAVYVVQALLFCATLWLAGSIVRHVTGSERAASITVLVCACWPAFYTTMMCSVMAEALFALLIAAALVCLIRAKAGGLGWPLACGLLLGLAALTKPAILPFVPVAAVLVALGRGRGGAARGGALLAAFAVCLAPWIARNRMATGRMIPVSTAGPLNLFIGNSPHYYATGDLNLRHWMDTAPFRGKSRPHQQAMLGTMALKRAVTHPATLLALFSRKCAIMWLGGLGRPPRESGPLSGARILGLAMEAQAVLFIPAVLLAVTGWRRLDREARARALPVVWLMGCLTFSYAATFSTMRYSVPLNPYLLLFAVAGIIRIRSAASERERVLEAS